MYWRCVSTSGFFSSDFVTPEREIAVALVELEVCAAILPGEEVLVDAVELKSGISGGEEPISRPANVPSTG